MSRLSWLVLSVSRFSSVGKLSRHIWLLAGALLIAGFVRLPQIYGDPPAGDLSRSGDFLTDEGIHGYSALQWALTGQWHTPDAFNPGVNEPIFTLYEYLLMQGFGVSLATVRYGGVFCGLMALLLLYFLLRRHDPAAALFATFLGAINFPLLVYNRLALLENLLLCFFLICSLLLSVYLRLSQYGNVAQASCLLLLQTRSLRYIVLFAFWMVMVLGYLTKASMAFFSVIFVLIVWQHEARERMKTFAFSAAFIIALATPLWFFWISPHFDDWQYYQQLNIPSKFTFSPWGIAQNYARFISHLKLFEFMPVTYVIALLMGLRGLVKIVQRKAVAPIPHLLYLWFWTGLLFLGFLIYSPPRFSLILMPAILGLNGLFFAEIFRQQSNSTPQKWPRYSFTIVAGVVLLQMAFGVYRIFAYQKIFLSCFLPAVGLLALYFIRRAAGDGSANRLTAWGSLTLILIVQGLQIARFHATMEFSLYDTAKSVAAILRQEGGKTVVLAGDSAMLLAFEVRVPTIAVMFRQDKLPLLLERQKPNYLFLEDPAELVHLQKQLPGYWDRVTVLGRYRLMNNYLHNQDAVLYRID